MIELTEFLPDVLPQADGCPKDTATRAVLRACRMLCKESWVWRENNEAETTVANIKEYDVVSPVVNASVLGLTEARHGVNVLFPATQEELSAKLGGSWPDLTGDFASHYIHPNPTTIRLVPYPATTQPLSLVTRVALMPTMSATEVGDVLFDEFNEVVVAGALSILLMMRDTEWYDPNLAVKRERDFKHGVANAKLRAAKGFTNKLGRLSRAKLAGAP